MQELVQAFSRRTFIGGAAALGAVSLVSPSPAFGVTAAEKQAEADTVRNQLVGLRAELEEAGELYYSALAEQEAARAAMEAEQGKIDDATAQIVELQDHLGTRARSMYRSGSSTFLDFLLGSASFAEFTQNWDILNNLNENDARMVADTKALRESIEASKDEYAKQEQIAAAKASEAKVIKDDADAKLIQANELMQSLDAEAQELLKQEQAAAAAAAAAQKQAEMEARERQNTNNNLTPVRGGNGVEIPSQGSVVDYALSRVGCPYVWSAAGPDAFDCSGLVTWAYAQIGMYVPHQSELQRNAARQIVEVSEARPGDVLWRYGHVGIAVGSGGVPYVHAPTAGMNVEVSYDLSWSNFTAALRF